MGWDLLGIDKEESHILMELLGFFIGCAPLENVENPHFGEPFYLALFSLWLKFWDLLYSILCCVEEFGYIHSYIQAKLISPVTLSGSERG